MKIGSGAAQPELARSRKNSAVYDFARAGAAVMVVSSAP